MNRLPLRVAQNVSSNQRYKMIQEMRDAHDFVLWGTSGERNSATALAFNSNLFNISSLAILYLTLNKLIH